MSTKEMILAVLESSDGFVSGETLSQQCGISRTAIWKQIQKFQQEGYQIESQHRTGYRLVGMNYVFNAKEFVGSCLESSGRTEKFYIMTSWILPIRKRGG